MRKNLLITPIAMVLVAGATSLSAQDFTTGTLAGRVTGPNGQPLAGVTVVLNSPSLLAPRQFTTDATGQFRAQMLMGGNYTITYTLSGYLTRRMTTYVAAGQTIRGDMQLRPMDVQAETVEIVATSSQQVDKTDTVVQSSLSQQKLIELTGGADVWSLISVIPGARSMSSDFRIRGGTQRGTKMLVDGSNITNMAEGTGYAVRYPMTDAIESVAIIQSPLNARYGNTDGGLISFVLNKGSNEFKGAVRVSLNREGDLWNEVSTYPDNAGLAYDITPGNDTLTKSYQFYLSGPLWKDHITFSWTSENTPTRKWLAYQYQSTTGIWVSGNGSTIDRSRYRVGTYFEAPNGEVIRKAEMLDASNPMNTIPRKQVRKDDTYTLFYQVTQNHQVEWSYMEAIGNNWNPTNYGMADMNANPIFNDMGAGLQRRWNLAYKGIIGTSGLLEARMGKSTQSWFNVQVDGRPKHSVSVLTISSYNPKNPNGNLSDPTNYLSNGLIDAYLNRQDSVNNSLGGGTSSYNFNANNEGPGDTTTNEPINVNYQHIMQTKLGQHIIDVGFQREKSAWINANLYSGGTINVNAERRIMSPGHIASDLQPSDIFNYTGTPLSEYRDKFIVFNMKYATFNSVDPYAFSRFNKGSDQNEPRDGNMLLTAWDNGQGYRTGMWPKMAQQYSLGNSSAYQDMYVQQMSYYLNDLWTINDHHSVMGGVRFDNYKVWSQDQGDIYSYSIPTLRFDYKFDIHGDQKRVVNVSWGQFHNMAGVSSWSAFFNRGVKDMIWWDEVDHTDGKPYLVDFTQMMDENNYRTIVDSVAGKKVNKVADGYKGLVSTEFTLGVRFNLDNGGSLRAAYIKRSIANDNAYLYNGWVDNPNGNGTKVISRLLDNMDVERSYNSVELEWNVPVTKRLDFGGSYTFARQMESNTGDANSPGKSQFKSIYYWKYYDEQFTFPHYGYKPTRLVAPEHYFNAYINYDLTYGKVKSNAALRFAYTSSSPSPRTYTYEMGFPIIPGITTSNAGEGQPSPMPYGASIGGSRPVYYNINRTGGADDWSLNLTYNLEVPVTNRVNWFATFTVYNPFNHIGRTGGYDLSEMGNGINSVIPNNIYRLDGSLYKEARNPYPNGFILTNYGDYYDNLFAPFYVQGGRSIGLQTGLRF
jgi:hypothetical protein